MDILHSVVKDALKIALLQETRADAGIYLPLINALDADSRFELKVINKPECLETTDWLIVLGDRRAMLEATIEAAYRNIPVAHIQGGDRSGTIDEPCRHAITRFAHIHFPCTQQSAKRLAKMGEEPWRIKVVGPLGIYALPTAAFANKLVICQKLGLDYEREIVLVIQHPVSTQQDQAGEQMRQTLEAVKGHQTVVIYPNSDPGSEAMVKEIECCNWIHKFKSLPYLQFLSLLRVSNVVVGNSSVGLYEAPLFGVPAVDIGSRQQDRERGINCTDVKHDAREIRPAIVRIWGKEDLAENNPFKVDIDGVRLILDTLASTPVNEKLLQKRLTY